MNSYENICSMSFNKTCRICLSLLENNYVSLFEQIDESRVLTATKIMGFAAVQIEYGDGLPGLICIKCGELVEKAYYLKLQCEKADRTLRRSLSVSGKNTQVYIEGSLVPNDFDDNFVAIDSAPVNDKNYLEEINKPISLNKFTYSANSNILDPLFIETNKELIDTEENSKAELMQQNSNLSLCAQEPYYLHNPKESNYSEDIKLEEKMLVNTKTLELNEDILKYHIFNNDLNPKDVKENKQVRKSLKKKNKIKGLKMNFDSMLLVCKVCEEKFEDNENLMLHMMEEHTGKEAKLQESSIPKLVCNVCNKTYLKASNLEAHMGTHTGVKPIQCTICERSFTQGRAFACHMRTHAETIEKPHRCTVCSKEFVEKKQLTLHLKRHTEREHTCSVCGKSYSNSGNLKSHMRLHTGDKPYECNFCERRFAQSNAHSYHMKTHLNDRPFKCEQCPKAFTTNAQLINHRRKHTGEKPFACSVCGKNFSQKAALVVHMANHTGNKPHSCSTCGKKFSQPGLLLKHSRSHTEKVQCNICGKSYSSTGNLTAHMKIHTGIKPHVCSVCERGFYVANKLAKHMRTHTGERPYACSVCQKRFTSSDVMRIHVRSHTGERPYRCLICNKGFTNSSQLNVHKRVHTTIRSHMCPKCFLTFNSEKRLSTHLKTCKDVPLGFNNTFDANEK